MKKLKIVLILVIFSAVTIIIFSPQKSEFAASKIKSYYSGDAISYQGRVIFASTNMRGVEIFELKNNKIELASKFRSFDSIYSGSEDFNDVMFRVEGDRLYMYLSDGRYMYRYDASNPKNPLLIEKIKDNSWDWFLSIGQCGKNLTTVGTKGVKIWNENLDVIYNNLNLTNKLAKNVQVDPSCNYIFTIENNIVNIFNRFSDSNISQVEISANGNRPRQMQFNQFNSSFYIVDDSSLREYDYSGNVLNKFEHASTQGFDVVNSSNPGYLYFSDGTGIVKLSKSNFKASKWVNTTNLGGNGGWAMQLKAVRGNQGERVIVYNGSNILVLDDNLKKIDSYAANEIDASARGELKIYANDKFTLSGSQVNVYGMGFAPEEDIKLYFAGAIFNSQTDSAGNFTARLTTPSVKTGVYDIKADGQKSKNTYSTSILIMD